MGLTRHRVGVSAIAALLVVGPVCVQAQDEGVNEWRVRSAFVEATVEADGGALVRVRYDLTGAGDDLPGTPLEVGLLQFEGTSVTEISVAGRAAPVVLWPTVGSHRAATFRPTRATLADGAVALDVTYRVSGAVREDGAAIRVRIPILSGPEPLAATPLGFRAEITVPDGWVVSEAFPSGLRATEDGTYVATLPVTPSMVGFRGRTDATWRPGFPLMVDLLTLAVLLVFGGFGWRHLRRAAA